MQRKRTAERIARPAAKRTRTQAPYVRFQRGYMPPRSGAKQEKKVSDIAVAAYQVNTTGVFTSLHQPILGTDFTQRVGRKTLIKSFYIRGYVAQEAALGFAPQNVPPQQCRMIVFVDNQPTPATALVVTDLLNTASPASHLNLNNRDRFKILADQVFNLGTWGLQTTATQTFGFTDSSFFGLKCYQKAKIESIFNATNGGTVADLTSGALYMFWIGSNAAGVNVDANAVVGTRVRYIDA